MAVIMAADESFDVSQHVKQSPMYVPSKPDPLSFDEFCLFTRKVELPELLRQKGLRTLYDTLVSTTRPYPGELYHFVGFASAKGPWKSFEDLVQNYSTYIEEQQCDVLRSHTSALDEFDSIRIYNDMFDLLFPFLTSKMIRPTRPASSARLHSLLLDTQLGEQSFVPDSKHPGTYRHVL